MRHARDPMKCEERRGNGARHEGSGQGRHAEDSTGRAARNRAVMSTPEGRKSEAPGRQVAGQLRRAAECDLLASRAERVGRWPDARRLRCEAHRLRRLARGPRHPELVLDFERGLATVRLERWAERNA